MFENMVLKRKFGLKTESVTSCLLIRLKRRFEQKIIDPHALEYLLTGVAIL
jgi:hypothetical protein